MTMIGATKQLLILLASWRLILFAAGALILLFFSSDPNYPIPSGHIFTNLRFLDAWANWDGGHYINIAQNGYQPGLTPLFPLSPLLIKILGVFFGGKLVLVGLLISFVATFGALFLLGKLTQQDWPDQINAPGLVWITALSLPAAFILGAVYTEALFLFLSLALFYTLRSKKYLWLIPLGFLISLTRQVGILLFPALMLDLWLDRQHSQHDRWWASFYLLSIPFGLLSYFIFLQLRFGDFSIFFRELWLWKSGSAYSILDSYRRSFGLLEMGTGSYYVNTFEVVIFSLYVLITPLIFRFMRASYGFLHLLLIAMPLVSNTLVSFPRYLLVSFPAILLFALLYQRSRWAWVGLTGTFIIFQGWLLYRFILGYWVF